jgi:SAM-dependent methyltransferase/uncharacterized protein YbaR (Trm112 family)
MLSLVRCPRDGEELTLESGEGSRISEGVLRCLSCSEIYEIKTGILRLVPGQRPVDAIVQNEQRARDNSAESYEKHFSPWENEEEFGAVAKNLADLRDRKILDLACGTGRITRCLIPNANVTIATDLSEQSLSLLATRIPADAKVGLIWADAIQLRFAPDAFDVVISTQLLEHIHESRNRIKLFQEISSWLSPAGSLLITVYYYNLLRRLLFRKQEGFHRNNIFYHRFKSREIRQELGQRFAVEQLRSLVPDRRFLASLGRFSPWARSGIPGSVLSAMIGELLFVHARKLERAETSAVLQ